MRRRLVVLVVLLTVIAAPARAEPLPYVVIINPPRMHRVMFGPMVTGALATSFDGRDASGIVGGGLAASVHVFGPYGDFKLWFAADVRVRVLADLSTPDAVVTLPVDLLVRTTYVTGYDHVSIPCPAGSADICLGHDEELPDPFQPYVALGGTVAFPLSPGDVRGGVVLALGLEWFADRAVPLFLELEGRALFGGANVLGQLALNLGVLFGP